MKEIIQKLLGRKDMMIIKLKQVVSSRESTWYDKSVRVNSNQIQYYYTDSIYRDGKRDWEITRMVFSGSPDIMVTQTLEEIDLILNEDMRVQRYEQPVL